MLFQTFRPESAVERFDERIVRRFSGAREAQNDAALIGPEVHVALQSCDAANADRNREALA
jgi:hypothetical protein